MSDNSNVNSKQGVFDSIGLASSMALVYVILYVALRLVLDKTITADGVALPAILIFVMISLIKVLLFKDSKVTPQWLTVGSFVVSSVMALIMALM